MEMNDDFRAAIGGFHGFHHGIHVSKQVLRDGGEAVVERAVVAVGEKVVGTDQDEEGVGGGGSGERLSGVSASFCFFRAQAQPVADVGTVEASVVGAVCAPCDFIGAGACLGGMGVVEYAAAVRDSRRHPAGVVAGVDPRRAVGNAVVREDFVQCPAVGAAVDAVGDGVPHVHDVAEAAVRYGSGGGEGAENAGSQKRGFQRKG